MQAGKGRSHDKITAKTSYFSGDEVQPSNREKSRNSSSTRRRSAKELSKRNLLSKQNQTAETLEWLSENYELIQGVCVPRCVLYTHYLDFCKKRKFSPAGPATFGKLIRQRFPKLTTRRLGTRGQSKYHYYGISIKESSVYYHSVYSGKGLTRFSSPEGKGKGITKKFSVDKKGGNTLPEFPSASEMTLNEDLSVEKVETFIIMYRTHCQRLLDTVMNANFNEVHKFLLHFWRGMPQHMVPVLECVAVIDIIVVCDSLLYKIFNDVLVPSCIQDIPDSLTEEIQDFAITFVNSLESCLENSPALLKDQKLRVAKNFVRLLKRNMTFINLAQTARPVFLSYESMSGILNEFRCLDLKKILTELLFLTEQETVELPVLLIFMEEFEHLLVKQAPIEAYAEWFDSIVEEYVLKDEKKMNCTSDDLSRRSQTFLTSWSFITSRILQELTLKGAPTFGSFQLIIMMFEEYILLIIENQLIAQLDEDLKQGLKRHLKDSTQTSQTAQGSQTRNSTDSEKHEVNRQNEKQSPSTQRAPLVQDKDQQMLFQNEIQQIESLESHHQKHPSYNFPPQRPRPPSGPIHNSVPSPFEDNFHAEEVYLGINAVPSEIVRIENIRGNQTHVYNLMSTQNEGNGFDFSRITAEKTSLQTSSSGFQASSYVGDDRGGYRVRGQGQFSGQGQPQNLSQNQVLYVGDVHLDGGHSSNQGHFENVSQGQSYFQGQALQGQGHDVRGYHEGQGQSRGYYKEYQYEGRISNHAQYSTSNQYHHSENQSAPQQNMNYNHTTSNSNYLFRESMSIGRPTDHEISSLSDSNGVCQEKTSLPSFFQLSSQLSSSTRLSTTY